MRPSSTSSVAIEAPEAAWSAPQSQQRVVIVANPFSGRGSNQARVAALVAALAEHEVIGVPVWDPQQRIKALGDATARADVGCIIAAGGDGTLADVIALCRDIPLAVWPMGNENLFARHFGFGRDPQRLAAAVARGRTVRVDLGLANERPFTVMLSAGFDAEVVHRVAAWRASMGTDELHRISRLSYARPIFSALGGYNYPRLRLTTDTGEVVEGTAAMVFNVPRYAMGLRFTPDALVDDGALDYVVFEHPGPLTLAWYLRAVAMGRHRYRRDVRFGRAKRVSITSDAAVPLQCDGDAAGLTPVDVRILPQALRVIDTLDL